MAVSDQLTRLINVRDTLRTALTDIGFNATDAKFEEIAEILTGIQTVEQATPGITVSSSGLITASADQSGGLVAAGTKSATKQLTTKGATTVTPTSSVQTIVNAGTYVTGAIKVNAGSTAKVKTGTYTLNNTTSDAITITHGLGVTPTMLGFFRYADMSFTSTSAIWLLNGVMYELYTGMGSGGYYTSVSRTITASQMTLDPNYRFYSGTYYWFVAST